MDLLKKLEEDAAGGSVGGGAAVAAVSFPLFSKAIVRKTNVDPTQPKKKKKAGIGLRERFEQLNEDPDFSPHNDFDETEVIGKLKALEKKNKIDRQNSTSFGLEDENGNVVRVVVASDQAEEFQNVLQAYLADDEDDPNKSKDEIAEILFDLRGRFNILDVVWPEIEEDQEEAQQIAGGEQPTDQNADTSQLDLGNEANAEVDTGAAQPGQGDVQGLLTQVIDMMTADAEARKAEAIARQKEAEMHAQKAQGASAHLRVKQEEEMMDMDDYFKQKNEQKKETKQLAKLAQWKRETSQDNVDVPGDEVNDAFTGQREEEEVASKLLGMKGRVPASQIANFLLKRIK